MDYILKNYVNLLDPPINFLAQMRSKNFLCFIIFGVRICVPNFSVIKSAVLFVWGLTGYFQPIFTIKPPLLKICVYDFSPYSHASFFQLPYACAKFQQNQKMQKITGYRPTDRPIDGQAREARTYLKIYEKSVPKKISTKNIFYWKKKTILLGKLSPPPIC